ncbi:MAG TPA: hypothetical protein PLH26_06165, partial [Agriterribacter sp.]|nr:hypothetical protein [Agriterribacter sp.]
MRLFTSRPIFPAALLPAILCFSFSCGSPDQKTAAAKNDATVAVSFVKQEAQHKVDVLMDGKLFTSYC